MINQSVRKQYSRQLEYFQGQIPLGIQSSVVPKATVDHYHDIIHEIEKLSGEDLFKFCVPDSIIWNDDSYSTDGFRDRLGSLIGYLKADIEEEKELGSTDTLRIITGIQRTFRKFFRKIPNSEKEVQEKMEDLFNGQSLIFKREQEHIPYSSKTYIPDFTFDDISLIVEVKFCNTVDREKELIAEINDDILAYSVRYKNMIFVVYDMGFIRDEDKFKHDIESKSVVIEIVKH